MRRCKRYIKSIDKGLLKVMSKMGISTYQSYCGAQIFDAVGLADDFVARYFTGTATQIGGVGLDEVAEETVRRHRTRSAIRRSIATRSMSAANTPIASAARRIPGRRNRCRCCSTPCAATAAETYKRLSPRCSTRRAEQPLTIRGLFRIKTRGGGRPRARADRGGRAGGADRAALRDRRHVLRLDLARGAYDARHRHEPHRRQVEHRRGRRGIRPLQAAAERQFHALGDQAGGFGPLRRRRRNISSIPT